MASICIVSTETKNWAGFNMLYLKDLCIETKD